MRAACIVLVAVLGCGPKQIVTPGQVVVDGDVTFSTKTGNAIDVIVHKTWDGYEATGLATLHGMTLEAAKVSPLVQVAGARAWLAILQQLTGKPASAYAGAKNAIEQLGDGYRTGRDGKLIIDDTGMHLKLAGISADNGDFKSAAQYAHDVLEERLAAYLRHFAGSVE